MTTHLENEAVLVSEAQAGSAESFCVLVKQYERQIYRLSKIVMGGPEDAEDVLQETFLKAYKNLKQFRGESRFYTWLVRITMNEALTRLRRRNSSTWVSLDEPIDTDESGTTPREIKDWRDNPEECYNQIELREILSKVLQDLETPLRTVFVLRDVEGLSCEETAMVTGLSVPAVKARSMRARLKLRKKLSFWFENRSALAARPVGRHILYPFSGTGRTGSPYRF
jgi:RNA polymerase sigma-70 factor (ECF subfamily)